MLLFVTVYSVLTLINPARAFAISSSQNATNPWWAAPTLWFSSPAEYASWQILADDLGSPNYPVYLLGYQGPQTFYQFGLNCTAANPCETVNIRYYAFCCGFGNIIQYRGSAPFGQVCPNGDYVAQGQTCPSTPVLPKRLGRPSKPGQCSCNDPIDVGSGNVFEEVTDYTTAGQNRLQFTRYYNSRITYGATTLASTLGGGWRSNFDRYLQITAASITAERADGQQVVFTKVGGRWVTDTDVDLTLTSSGPGFTLTDSDDTVETYQEISATEAVVVSIQARGGYTQTLQWAGTQLQSVTDSYGRMLSFAYQAGLLQTVQTPDNTTLNYGYDSSGLNPGVNDQLISVTYPTSPTTSITYRYIGLPFVLTNEIDEDGNGFRTWTYDGEGRAIAAFQGGGANLSGIFYNDANGTSTVTNAFGVADTYTFATLQGVPKIVSISRAATATTRAAVRTFGYDMNGYLANSTDWNGNTTVYTNNNHGQPTMVTEAAGSAVMRTTSIVYDPVFVHLPDTITTQGVTTSYRYDANGNPLSKTLTDTTSQTIPYSTQGRAQLSTYTWSNFLLASATTANFRTTNFSYSGTGALTKITNPLGQITNITQSSGGGYPETIVDPNGVTTTLTYDGRQRLLSRAVSGSGGTFTTTYTVDPTGEITRVTLPDNSYLAYTFDGAHRLYQVTDTQGNNVQFTLDALGDRTQINTYDSSNTLHRQHSATFDALGRMLSDVGGAGQTTTYSYDSNGNALTITDPLRNLTFQSFDALNRLSSIQNLGTTTFLYDSHDRPLAVIAPNNETQFVYDGFGDLIQQTSPDSGKTIYSYDSDGNLVSKTDALGGMTNNTFDALDRLLTTTYPADGRQNVVYTYDQTGSSYGFGIGKLTSVTDAAGALSHSYDERGNLLTEQRIGGGKTLATQYAYDAAGRIATMTYPDGAIVSNQYTSTGYLSQVSAQPAASKTSSAIATIGHLPFGALNSALYGNGVSEMWTFDLDYRATNLQDASSSGTLQGLTYGYDAGNNVKTITDAVNAANTQTFGYDALNRLTSAVSGTGGYGAYAWTYDLVGNRLTQTLGSATTTYSYSSGNRLWSVNASGTTTLVSTNANGNITSIPPANGNMAATFAYSAANRLSSVMGSPLAATFVYDAFGRRFSKTNPGSTPTLYIYGQDGSLLEESNSAVTDYVYADGRPIAVLKPGASPQSNQVNFVLADRLGTPRLVSNSSGSTVWSATYQPYGAAALSGASMTQNLRLPGQYFDAETGFHHNGFRDYMPNLGRYLESDPIGQAGGINSYGYVGQNPSKWSDPTGECPWCIGAVIGGLAAGFGLHANNPTASLLDYLEAVSVGAAFGAVGVLAVPEGLAYGVLGGALAGSTGDIAGQYVAASSRGENFCPNWWEFGAQGALGALGGGLGSPSGVLGRQALEDLGVPTAEAQLFGQQSAAAVGGIFPFGLNLSLAASLGGYEPSSDSESLACGCH